MKRLLHTICLAAGFIWVACGPAPESTRLPAGTMNTKESLFAVGHQFYIDRNYDSADVYLSRSSLMDPSYVAPANDLAQMHYMLGMQYRGETNPERLDQFRKSFTYYTRLESHGSNDAELYERLSELSSALNDKKSLVKYAKRNANLFPYERQYFNLGFAYFESGDFQSVIKSQKEAIAKFKGSTFIGSFYRQLGRAYMKIDRDQTAERTFDAGLGAVDSVVAERSKSDRKFATSDEYRRLIDDKIGMLVSLRGLHQIYRATDKLDAVEQQLRELGYTK